MSFFETFYTATVEALRATLPTAKRDLQWVRSAGDWDMDNEMPDGVSVHCAKCHGEIDFDFNHVDKLLSKFRCPKEEASYFSIAKNGCGLEWPVPKVEKMTPGELGAAMYTALRIPDEPIYKFVEKTNGLTRYTATEEMNGAEKTVYYQKALRGLREKK